MVKNNIEWFNNLDGRNILRLCFYGGNSSRLSNLWRLLTNYGRK